jgi:hypothetical protein
VDLSGGRDLLQRSVSGLSDRIDVIIPSCFGERGLAFALGLEAHLARRHGGCAS